MNSSTAAVASLLITFITCPLLSQETSRDSTAADSLPDHLLEPVVVTVTRTPSDLFGSPLAVSVVDERFLRRGRRTLGLSESLVAVPGVVASNRHNASLDERISIRGFGARSAFGVRGVKVLIDGIPQTLPDGQGQLTNLELAEVERIEVIRGSASALYGNASGGVISIRTRSPAAGEPRYRARLSVGEFETFKWNVGSDIPLGRAVLQVAGSRTVSDGFRRHSAYEQRRAHLKFRYPVSGSGEFSVTLSVADNPEADNPGSLTMAQLDSARSMADPRNLAAGAGKDVSQTEVGVSYHTRLGGGGSLEFTAFALARDLSNPLSFAFINLDRAAAGVRSTLTVPLAFSRLTGIAAGFDLQFQDDDRLNRSPDLTRINLDQTERVLELGPFVQLTAEPLPYVEVTAGGRYDRIRFEGDDRLLEDGDDSGSRVMAALSGTFGVIYKRWPIVHPYFSAGTSFETPTTTELVNRPEGGGGFNQELDPQKSTTYELGAKGMAGGILTFDAALFETRVRDELIPFEVASQPGRRFFRNAGRSRRRGLEVGARVLWRDMDLRLAYTHADYRFLEFRTSDTVFDGNELPGVPRDQFHASFQYSLGTRAWIALDNTLSSAYYVNDLNTVENESWYVMSLRAGAALDRGGARFRPFFGVSNLFDRDYVPSVVVNARGGRYFEPAPGRTFYAGTGVGF